MKTRPTQRLEFRGHVADPISFFRTEPVRSESGASHPVRRVAFFGVENWKGEVEGALVVLQGSIRTLACEAGWGLFGVVGGRGSTKDFRFLWHLRECWVNLEGEEQVDGNRQTECAVLLRTVCHIRMEL